MVIGDGLECAEFQLLLIVGLRALIDKLDAATFNVGVFNIVLEKSSGSPLKPAPLLARCDEKARKRECSCHDGSAINQHIGCCASPLTRVHSGERTCHSRDMQGHERGALQLHAWRLVPMHPQLRCMRERHS